MKIIHHFTTFTRLLVTEVTGPEDPFCPLVSLELGLHIVFWVVSISV